MQTKIGAQKYKERLIQELGSEEAYKYYMRSLGSKGGKTPTKSPKGFAAATAEQRSEWAKKGGSKSKRGKNKEDETNLTDKQKYYRKWYKNNGRKRHELQQKAHSIVSKAILKGDLIRPEKCTRCERTFKIEGHHEDYDKPLEVIWLCNRCHRKIHTGS